MTEEQKEKGRIRQRRYEASAKGKETKRMNGIKYRASIGGRDVAHKAQLHYRKTAKYVAKEARFKASDTHRIWWAKKKLLLEEYRKTSEYKESRRRYKQSENCKMSDKKYWTSALGVANATRYRRSEKGKKTALSRSLLKNYGITLDQYNKLCMVQGGVCAICGQGNPDGKRLHVDHDHITGKVRGLLCGKHNSGLGLFQDNIGLLHAAATYLQRPPAAGVL